MQGERAANAAVSVEWLELSLCLRHVSVCALALLYLPRFLSLQLAHVKDDLSQNAPWCILGLVL